MPKFLFFSAASLHRPLRRSMAAVAFSMPVALLVNELVALLLGHRGEQLVQSRWISLGITFVVAGSISFLVAWRVQKFEHQLAQLNEELSAAVAEKNELLAIVSHDLKSPLSAMISASDLLLQEELGPSARELAEMILSKAGRMYALVASLLDLCRAEEGTLPSEAQHFELADLVSEAAMGHRYQADQKGVQLSCVEAPQPVWVHAAVSTLTQVLDNLIGNAVKYSPQGGKVTLEVKQHGAEALFSCRDQGPGMTPELSARIFGKYQSGDNPDPNGTLSTGLGLYIAKKLTDSLGGRIWYESHPDKGSIFFVGLPSVAPSPSA
ncbi:MAG: HAMP domain-containing sensor histidine kinase [bacterium]|nr:HAMP domain-containing sensor histidine kinase [bacterium]